MHATGAGLILFAVIAIIVLSAVGGFVRPIFKR